ncbi:lantibiotic dehydratase [Nucisporomicrobium flavum]|uniref:lantibiotic dehydratase n=1 Tax=Nucisporomicrobium flavum TaxID=2785915 RepID=UPI0018F53F28|nr:lantibiotic dehydratase [Nucisporomicrobium flavum]
MSQDPPLYLHAGGAMLRAAAFSLDEQLGWPDMGDPQSCRRWLSAVWGLPGFAEAARYASTPFAQRIEAVIGGDQVDPRRLRAATLSAMRYLLRATGRVTPFGMFAGVAPAIVGDDAQVRWAEQHRPMVRPGTVWLDTLIARLERLASLLTRVDVVFCDLVTDRGERIEAPTGAGHVSVRNTAVVRLIRQVAAYPVAVATLADKITAQFPHATSDTVRDLLSTLVEHGILITSLRAAMTDPDPLRHLVDQLDRHGTGIAEVEHVTAQLRAIQALVDRHNDPGTAATAQVEHRAELTDRMRQLSATGRSPLAGDLYLDCQLRVPRHLADEMAAAASALLRLTREPRRDDAWDDWAREFWERYGSEVIVPVTEAIHPDAGIGLPAGFPASPYPEFLTTKVTTARDQELLRLAWETMDDGGNELVLTDDMITAITAGEPVDERHAAPHLELGARIRAASPAALNDGDYLFDVHPAWTMGAFTSRFRHAVSDAGLDTAWRSPAVTVDGALAVQLSFPPLYPHAQNISRQPAYLPQVLSVGEHRGHSPDVIRLDDVGVVWARDRVHLISISRRQLLEPQVLHALALPKQAPAVARFLAMLSRGSRGRLTVFTWGPPAELLPHLPRVRYRRAILSPETWRITAAAYAAMRTDWDTALAAWRQKWRCPPTVELLDEDRSLRLTLTVAAHRQLLRAHLDEHDHATLTETATHTDTGWADHHIAEVVMPFVRDRPPAANTAVTGYLPVTTNRTAVQLPAAPQTAWLYAQVFTGADRIDDLLRTLPGLLTELDHPMYWFARYRSVREPDHLRLRIRVDGPEQYAATATVVGRWAQQLRDRGATSRMNLATYRPEIGRYGDGPATAAAEAVFAADSHAVVTALPLLAGQRLHPQVLTAAGLTDIADAFHHDRSAATQWLLDHLPASGAPTADRSVIRQAISGAHDPGNPPGLATAWQQRRAALTAYRACLAPDADQTKILAGLLHMHHNRARGVDRDDEATCQHLTRRIALARRARTSS